MIELSPYINIFNGETVKLETVPVLELEEFWETLMILASGCSLIHLRTWAIVSLSTSGLAKHLWT